MKASLRWAVVGLTALFAGWILLVAPYQAAVNGIDNLWLISWLGLLVVGGFLVARRPEHRLSWTLAAIGLLASSAAIGEGLALTLGGGWGLVVGLMSNLAIGGFVLIPLVLLWYPTGRVPSEPWLWLERALISLGALLTIYYVLRPGSLGVTGYENPFGIGFLAPLRDSPVEQGAGLLVALLGVCAFASLVVRWRGAKGPERSQLKLVALAVFLTMGWFALTLGLGLFLDIQNPVVDTMQVLIFVLGVNGLALAIAMAIVRYRLYEIDRVISRTVSYALVVGLLAVLFLGAVTLVTWLLPAQSDLAVAASTLAVAASFNPLRSRVQARVDRRFNRSRFDAERVMAGFSETLRDEMDPDAVIDGWVSVVSATMQPASSGVWVREAR